MNQKKNFKPSPAMIMIIISLVATLVLNVFITMMSYRSASEISYSEFLRMLDKGQIQSVFVDDTIINIYPKNNPDTTYYVGVMDDPGLVERLNAAGVEFKPAIHREQSPIISFLLSWVIPIGIMFFFFSMLSRKMGDRLGDITNKGSSQAKFISPKDIGVTFADVAGQEEAKESLTEIVDFLKFPAKYTDIGAKLPKGALLVGPPGTGKTLLARAVAGEAGVAFYSVTGSDFVEMFVGVGASRIRDMFKEAVKHAPCIIFIDEIDAIGKRRGDGQFGSNDEREQTLNQLLSEMDGFNSAKGVVVLAATNRPEILDPALLRPGRFDRRIIVDRPDLKGRLDILKVHVKNVRLDANVSLEGLAAATAGASGADLANIINEAALRAVRMGRNRVEKSDLMEAMETVMAGKEKRDRIMSDDEKRIVAYHEVGHALISTLQKGSYPLQKITIVPRTSGALGYVLQTPDEDKFLYSRADLENQITSLMGGRAAEEFVFGDISTGAANDIERATEIARKMVTEYGMSEKFKNVQLSRPGSTYLGGNSVMNCSDITASEVDAEVQEIINRCYNNALQTLKENAGSLNTIAEYLFQRETIHGDEFMELLQKVSP